MHEQFLRAALQQACLGRGRCAPNPSVGAVATRSGEIIAQSWHRGAGSAHAETLLLAQLPKNCSDITLYVTLEPCNHWGKTPPCVDAIIQSGIRSVVYAYADPNPVVSANNTPALLKEHGISVLHYPLSEIDDFYRSYRHWTLAHTPWVTIKLAQTFDGKIAGVNGERVQLSNALCSEFTHEQRARSDVILTTARTVNQDDPDLTVRLSGQEHSKPVAIIDARLTLNQQAKVIEKATHCHVYHDARYTPAPHKKCTFHALSTHKGRFELSDVMRHLGSLGYHDVWVEAGAILFDALHQNRLINQTYLYLVPKVLGSLGLSAYQNTIFDVPFQLTWRASGDNMIAQFDWKE